MPVLCTSCGIEIPTMDFMTCSKCPGVYDLCCLQISPKAFRGFTQNFKDEWMCPTCKSALPKGDNSNTPVRGKIVNVATRNENVNVNLNRGSKRTQSPDTDLSSLVEEIKEMRLELHELRVQYQEITISKQDLLGLKEELRTMSDSVSKKLVEYDVLVRNKDSKISALEATVAQLHQTVNDQNQRELRNVVEIVGITEMPGENLYHLVMRTAEKIGVKLADTDIESVSRVGSRRSGTDSNSAPSNMPRPIIAKLLRRASREELLKAAKSRRELTTEGITPGNPTRVYLNERLTKENRSLFKLARIRIRQHNFRYCWVREGAIYVKKEEGRPAIRINYVSDLDKKIGPDVGVVPQ